MGFGTSKLDSSVFVWRGQHELVSILLYVHNFVIAGAGLDEIDRVKSQHTTSYDMNGSGDLHYFLGIEVICTPEGILVSK